MGKTAGFPCVFFLDLRDMKKRSCEVCDASLMFSDSTLLQMKGYKVLQTTNKVDFYFEKQTGPHMWSHPGVAIHIQLLSRIPYGI